MEYTVRFVFFDIKENNEHFDIYDVATVANSPSSALIIAEGILSEKIEKNVREASKISAVYILSKEGLINFEKGDRFILKNDFLSGSVSFHILKQEKKAPVF